MEMIREELQPRAVRPRQTLEAMPDHPTRLVSESDVTIYTKFYPPGYITAKAENNIGFEHDKFDWDMYHSTGGTRTGIRVADWSKLYKLCDENNCKKQYSQCCLLLCNFRVSVPN